MLLKYLNNIKLTNNKILDIDLVQLNENTGHVTPNEREIIWNSSDGTLDVGLKNDVVMQVGQETYYSVRNSTGSTILNGTPVYCNGVTAGSGRMEATPSNNTIDPVTFLGLATEDINNGVNGYVTYFGYVRGLDTRGTTASSIAVGDENWSVGDKLYVHPSVAGKLTNVEPQAPNVKICVAVIINRHQNAGVLFVRPTTNLKINKLSDVNITNAQNGEVLTYDSNLGVWKNSQLSANVNAESVSYDNSDTDLNSTNVQSAINELYTLIKYTSGFYVEAGSSSTVYDPSLAIDSGSSLDDQDAVILNGGGS
jgi:hypothetical protein